MRDGFGAVAGIAYLAMGLLQWAAISSGLDHWIGVSGFLSVMLALPLAYLPVVGAVLGVVGAVQEWRWSVPAAALLFFWPLPVGLVAVLVSSARDRRRA